MYEKKFSELWPFCIYFSKSDHDILVNHMCIYSLLPHAVYTTVFSTHLYKNQVLAFSKSGGVELDVVVTCASENSK